MHNSSSADFSVNEGRIFPYKETSKITIIIVNRIANKNIMIRRVMASEGESETSWMLSRIIFKKKTITCVQMCFKI